MTTYFDVIVVGGGPGGSSAAYFLTQQGLSVLLLERKSLPRYKTCAGGVPTSALKIFPFQFDSIIEQYIHWSTFVYKHQSVTQELPPKSLVMVMRDSLDNFLVKRSGAEVMENCPVHRVVQERQNIQVITENGRIFRAKYVIGADGVNSRVGKSLGIRNNAQTGIALEAEIPVKELLLHRFHGHFVIGIGVLKNGYYWIFPKSNHLSVGIGSMYCGVKSLSSILSQSMAKHGICLEKKLLKAYPLPRYHGHRPIQNGRILLVGDAAGLVDPLTGEGIRPAIKSGQLAAEAIACGQIDRYSSRIKATIGYDFFLSKPLASLFYSHQYYGFQLLIRNRYIFRDMMKILNQQHTYRRSLFRLLLYVLGFTRRIPTN
ncbi:MAG TPA: geranylgeranyl reductase family protein [Desulfohalobiaceae bacterium]|nr:geranylgeranyl reductase family protein [Desulfohalobiaceae bacterium]